ncbi:MAG: phytanoyl-CoA dioxygenase family protein [Thermodesulfobacteriota bacterium]
MSRGLTEEQAAAYWRDGYVCVRGLFAEADVEPWLRRTRELAAGEVAPPPAMQLVRDVMVAKKAFAPPTREHAICKINFYENDPVFMAYARHPALLDCVESLLGPELLFVNSMVITKPPGVDGRHPLHQDLLYFGFRPGDAVVGSWTALEPVTRENGCLAVLPGSHRGELLPHEVPDWQYVNFGFLGANGVDASVERVHVEMEPGDTLLFHSLLLHGSGQNRTSGFRRAISAHYARGGCEDLWGGRDILASRPWLPVRGAALA